MDTQQPPVGGPSDSKETVKITPVEAAAHLYGNGFQPNDTLQKGHRVAIVAHVEGDTITAVFHNPRNEAQPLSVRACTSQQLASWQRSKAESADDLEDKAAKLTEDLARLQATLDARNQQIKALLEANAKLEREKTALVSGTSHTEIQEEILILPLRPDQQETAERVKAELTRLRNAGWQVESEQWKNDYYLARLERVQKVMDAKQPEPEPVSLSALVPGLVKEEAAA